MVSSYRSPILQPTPRAPRAGVLSSTPTPTPTPTSAPTTGVVIDIDIVAFVDTAAVGRDAVVLDAFPPVAAATCETRATRASGAVDVDGACAADATTATPK